MVRRIERFHKACDNLLWFDLVWHQASSWGVKEDLLAHFLDGHQDVEAQEASLVLVYKEQMA